MSAVSPRKTGEVIGGFWRTVFICGYWVTALYATAQTQPDLPVAEKGAHPAPASQPVGLFIGIGKYAYQAGVKPLVFAPDDAVALAHLFVVERGWIRPEDAHVALSGVPKSTVSQARLSELKQRGVRLVSPTRIGLERALTQLHKSSSQQKQDARPIILTFSGHGNLLDGTAYFLPADSDWSAVRSTSLTSRTILSKWRNPEAPKLWLIDSCTTKLDIPPLERIDGRRSFQDQLEKVPKLTVLAACQPGEKGYQSDQLKQGVYTHFLLQAIRSTAPTNAPFASLDWLKISDQAAETTRQWLAAKECFDQHPWHFSTAQPAPPPAAQ